MPSQSYRFLPLMTMNQEATPSSSNHPEKVNALKLQSVTGDRDLMLLLYVVDKTEGEQ